MVRGTTFPSLAETVKSLLVALTFGHFVGLASAMHAAGRSFTRESRRVRVGALVLLPYLFVPLYWGLVLSRRIATRRLERASRVRTEEVLRSSLSVCRTPSQDPVDPILQRLGALPMSVGNAVEVLVDGGETFLAIYERLQEAQSYVLVQFYLIRPDNCGQEFMHVLLEVLSRGVRVYLLYDPLEGRPPESLLETFKAQGGVAAEYCPDGLSCYNFRNHRKVVVVDGRYAFLGGFNVGDEYLSLQQETSPWRDTHFALRGPAVVDIQLAFVEDFSLSGETPHVTWNAFEREVGSTDCSVVCSGPYHHVSRCRHIFLHALAQARRRVWLATPFFAPDEAGAVALEQAVMRGVEVIVILPRASEVAVADLLSWTYVEQLLPLGVKFFRFREGSMHQKVLLVDDDIVVAGSANYDFRSFHLNHEIVLWANDPSLNRRVEMMLLHDLADCRAIEREEMESRGVIEKIRTSLARVMDLMING